MTRHTVVTVQRGTDSEGRPGFAARCETEGCGEITFGGFPSRSAARARSRTLPSAGTRAEIAGNVRYWIIIELRCANNSTALRDLLGISSRRAQGLYAGRVDYTVDELIRLGIALGHPLEAFYNRDLYELKSRAGRIARRLVKYLQEGHTVAENEDAIMRAFAKVTS